MNIKIFIVVAIALALLCGFGLGYISRTPDSKEAQKNRKELEQLKEYAEFSGEFEIKKVSNVKKRELPKLEKDIIIYSENEDFFPLSVYYWIGSGWGIDTVNEVYSAKFRGAFNLIDVYPTSITYFKKDMPSLNSDFETYSKVKIFRNQEEIKSIADKLENPGIYYDPSDYEGWSQDRKDRIRGRNKPEDDTDYGREILTDLSKRNDILILDYGYIKVAVSFISKEVFDRATKQTDIDIISYHGSSNELCELLKIYGESPDILWKKEYKIGIGH